MAADDIHVELHEGRLVVSGEKKIVKEEGKKGVDKVWVQERRACKFSRAFTLPEDAQSEGIAARLEHGVLTVDIPKTAPPPKPEPKRIQVVAAGAGQEHSAGPANGQ